MLMVVLAMSCRVDPSSLGDFSPAADQAVAAQVATGLPVVGPVPASSHWHAAYVVRICDDVLAPFDSDADPLGIHSHADGLMHIHPFFEESGYEQATLGLFADAMEFEIAEGELTVPGAGTWRDGDLCNGVPGRVYVDRWMGPSPDSEIERVFTDLQDIRYLADGELYHIAFAPETAPPVVPPSAPDLFQVSNFGPAPVPWVDVDPTATLEQVQIWQVDHVSSAPCTGADRPERVLSGPARCFSAPAETLAGADAIESARAVDFNRRAAIEITMTPPTRRLIEDHFAASADPLVLAVEVDGMVITAPQLVRPPVSNRLVVSGGFSTETAQALAVILDNET